MIAELKHDLHSHPPPSAAGTHVCAKNVWGWRVRLRDGRGNEPGCLVSWVRDRHAR